MNLSRAVGAAVATVLLSTAMIGQAQSAGALDLSFGTGGKVVTDFFRAADEIHGLAIAADGTLVAAGTAFKPNNGFDFAVARYSARGVLIPPVAVFDFHPGGLNDEAVAVATLADGRIVVAGRSAAGTASNYDFAVARLLPSLAGLDPTFGVNGRMTTDFFGKFDDATGMVVQPDGRIVVAGMVTNPTDHQDVGLVRYTFDGKLDTTFGAGGRVVTDLSPTSEYPFGMALQLDGKVILVGASFNTGANELTMVRYLPNGSLDENFGARGKVLLNNYPAVAHAVTVQDDGRIVVAGVVLIPPQGADFAVWRFEANGALDRSFGNLGRAFAEAGHWDSAEAVAVQPDGKIVAAGYTQLYANFMSTDFAAVRLTSSGRLDPTFGTNGVAVADLAGDGDPGAAVAIQPGGGIVIGGRADNPQNGSSDFGLVRFKGVAATRPPVTRHPIADAYVRGGTSAEANFGTAAQLLAKLGVSDDNSRISYLKFDLRDVASVNRATLRLNGRLSNTTTSSVQTTVRAVGSISWDERTVTWRNRPAIGTALGSFTVRGITAQWHEIDITAYVQAEKRAGRNVITLALQNTTHSSAQVQAASREAGAQAPALIIQP
jgi:uncharacterized delta-60 repeat protein